MILFNKLIDTWLLSYDSEKRHVKQTPVESSPADLIRAIIRTEHHVSRTFISESPSYSFQNDLSEEKSSILSSPISIKSHSFTESYVKTSTQLIMKPSDNNIRTINNNNQQKLQNKKQSLNEYIMTENIIENKMECIQITPIKSSRTPISTPLHTSLSTTFSSEAYLLNLSDHMIDRQKQIVFVNSHEKAMQLKLKNEILDRDQQIQNLQHELLSLRRHVRGSDGEVLFLQYQLDKLRAEKSLRIKGDHSNTRTIQDENQIAIQNNTCTEVVLYGDAVTTSHTVDRQAWLLHWSKSRAVLSALLSNFVSESSDKCVVVECQNKLTAGLETDNLLCNSRIELVMENNRHETNIVSNDNITQHQNHDNLEHQLFLQKKITQKLENRLRTWFELQMKALCTLTEEDIYTDVNDVKLPLPVSTLLPSVSKLVTSAVVANQSVLVQTEDYSQSSALASASPASCEKGDATPTAASVTSLSPHDTPTSPITPSVSSVTTTPELLQPSRTSSPRSQSTDDHPVALTSSPPAAATHPEARVEAHENQKDVVKVERSDPLTTNDVHSEIPNNTLSQSIALHDHNQIMKSIGSTQNPNHTIHDTGSDTYATQLPQKTIRRPLAELLLQHQGSMASVKDTKVLPASVPHENGGNTLNVSISSTSTVVPKYNYYESSNYSNITTTPLNHINGKEWKATVLLDEKPPLPQYLNNKNVRKQIYENSDYYHENNPNALNRNLSENESLKSFAEDNKCVRRFKDNMDKLREDNITMRDDLKRFRGTLKVRINYINFK